MATSETSSGPSPGQYGMAALVLAMIAALFGLLVVVVNEALSLGMLCAPGELGADLVCGDAQSFGVATSFGGPALGFLCPFIGQQSHQLFAE